MKKLYTVYNIAHSLRSHSILFCPTVTRIYIHMSSDIYIYRGVISIIETMFLFFLLNIIPCVPIYIIYICVSCAGVGAFAGSREGKIIIIRYFIELSVGTLCIHVSPLYHNYTIPQIIQGENGHVRCTYIIS